MDTRAKIRAAAKRILSPMTAFKTPAVGPEGTEDAIGVYDAPGGSGPVWVTTTGLVLPNSGGVETVRYNDMREVLGPTSKEAGNTERTRVEVVMDQGRTVTLSITGGRGRFCDSFEFARFLARASRFAREPE